MRAIIETQNSINDSEPSLTSVMRIVVERAQELTDATGAVIELAEGDDMVYAATAGSVSGRGGVRLALQGSLSGLSVRTGEVLTCSDSEDDPRVDRDACRRVGARSMVVVPLLSKRVSVGVLKVLSDEPAKFDDDDIELLNALAGFIGVSIDQAALHDETHLRATTDPLTGRANRSQFTATLRAAIAQSERNEAEVGVVFIDLDGFKPINDKHGHEAGDHVLVVVADRLRTVTRAGEQVARLGGDDFAVSWVGDGSAVAAVHERLEAAVTEPIV